MFITGRRNTHNHHDRPGWPMLGDPWDFFQRLCSARPPPRLAKPTVVGSCARVIRPQTVRDTAFLTLHTQEPFQHHLRLQDLMRSPQWQQHDGHAWKGGRSTTSQGRNTRDYGNTEDGGGDSNHRLYSHPKYVGTGGRSTRDSGGKRFGTAKHAQVTMALRLNPKLRIEVEEPS